MTRLRGGLSGIPRGAIAVIVFGLFLCVVCALLTNTDLVTGESLGYESTAEIPDSKPAKLGADGEIRIGDANINATRANGSGYRLYRVAGVLDLTTGDSEGGGEATCTVRTPQGITFAHTPERRAAFPNPSEDLTAQSVPDLVLVNFNAKGTDVVQLATGDAFDNYASSGDILVDWGDYAEHSQTWKWSIRPGGHREPIRLGFIVFWRSVNVQPSAQIRCSASGGGNEATTSTGGNLGS